MDSSSQSSEMPQEMARKLFEEGALLIVAGIPTGTEIGVDLNSNKADEMFRGIKMIPPGPHFVHTAAEGAYGDTASRVGFIHFYKRQEIVIREWNDQTEELRERSQRNIELDQKRIRDNLAELDKFLAPYNFEQLRKWQLLTNEITEDVIARAAPEHGIIRSSAEFQSCPDADRPKGQSPLTHTVSIRPNQIEDDLLPNLKVVPGTAPRFTKIPALHANDASPAEISQCHMDAIRAIENYFQQFSEPYEAIREIQMSFILFLCGCSLDALAHWRKILGLLAKSETAVKKFKVVYRRYLDLLKYQLIELPEELMLPTPNNSVFKDVKQLVVNCTIGGLKDESDALSAHLTKEISWYFDDIFEEDPEDLPVVVELETNTE